MAKHNKLSDDDKKVLESLRRGVDEVTKKNLKLLTTDTSKKPIMQLLGNSANINTSEMYILVENIRELNVKFDSIRKELYGYDGSKKEKLKPELRKTIKEIIDNGTEYEGHIINLELLMIEQYIYERNYSWKDAIIIHSVYYDEISKLSNVLNFLNGIYYGSPTIYFNADI